MLTDWLVFTSASATECQTEIACLLWSTDSVIHGFPAQDPSRLQFQVGAALGLTETITTHVYWSLASSPVFVP